MELYKALYRRGLCKTLVNLPHQRACVDAVKDERTGKRIGPAEATDENFSLPARPPINVGLDGTCRLKPMQSATAMAQLVQDAERSIPSSLRGHPNEGRGTERRDTYGISVVKLSIIEDKLLRLPPTT